MKGSQMWLPVLAGLIAPMGLSQPAGAAVKSADEIACELGGECPVAPAADAAATTDAAPVDPFDDAPTRGWTFGSKPKAKERQEPVVVRPAQRVVPSRPRPVEFTTLDVQFPRGSATISSELESQMEELYTALRRPSLTGRKFRIIGHTVAAGSPALNKDLSVRRAKAVADYLTSKGIDPSFFEVDGLGDARPLRGVTQFDPSNRRVEIERID